MLPNIKRHNFSKSLWFCIVQLLLLLGPPFRWDHGHGSRVVAFKLLSQLLHSSTPTTNPYHHHDHRHQKRNKIVPINDEVYEDLTDDGGAPTTTINPFKNVTIISDNLHSLYSKPARSQTRPKLKVVVPQNYSKKRKLSKQQEQILEDSSSSSSSNRKPLKNIRRRYVEFGPHAMHPYPHPYMTYGSTPRQSLFHPYMGHGMVPMVRYPMRFHSPSPQPILAPAPAPASRVSAYRFYHPHHHQPQSHRSFLYSAPSQMAPPPSQQSIPSGIGTLSASASGLSEVMIGKPMLIGTSTHLSNSEHDYHHQPPASLLSPTTVTYGGSGGAGGGGVEGLDGGANVVGVIDEATPFANFVRRQMQQTNVRHIEPLIQQFVLHHTYDPSPQGPTISRYPTQSYSLQGSPQSTILFSPQATTTSTTTTTPAPPTATTSLASLQLVKDDYDGYFYPTIQQQQKRHYKNRPSTHPKSTKISPTSSTSQEAGGNLEFDEDFEIVNLSIDKVGNKVDKKNRKVSETNSEDEDYADSDDNDYYDPDEDQEYDDENENENENETYDSDHDYRPMIMDNKHPRQQPQTNRYYRKSKKSSSPPSSSSYYIVRKRQKLLNRLMNQRSQQRPKLNKSPIKKSRRKYQKIHHHHHRNTYKQIKDNSNELVLDSRPGPEWADSGPYAALPSAHWPKNGPDQKPTIGPLRSTENFEYPSYKPSFYSSFPNELSNGFSNGLSNGSSNGFSRKSTELSAKIRLPASHYALLQPNVPSPKMEQTRLVGPFGNARIESRFGLSTTTTTSRPSNVLDSGKPLWDTDEIPGSAWNQIINRPKTRIVNWNPRTENIPNWNQKPETMASWNQNHKPVLNHIIDKPINIVKIISNQNNPLNLRNDISMKSNLNKLQNQKDLDLGTTIITKPIGNQINSLQQNTVRFRFDQRSRPSTFRINPNETTTTQTRIFNVGTRIAKFSVDDSKNFLITSTVAPPSPPAPSLPPPTTEATSTDRITTSAMLISTRPRQNLKSNNGIINRCKQQQQQDNKPEYFADKENQCKAYFHCGPNGSVIRFSCPIGTRFSEERSICDWPALVPNC